MEERNVPSFGRSRNRCSKRRECSCQVVLTGQRRCCSIEGKSSRVFGNRSGHDDTAQPAIDGIDQNGFLVLDQLSCEGDNDSFQVIAQHMSDIGQPDIISSSHLTRSRTYVLETSQDLMSVLSNSPSSPSALVSLDPLLDSIADVNPED